MTKHHIYHPLAHPAAAAPYLSSQHWHGLCQRLEQKKLVSVSSPQPSSQLVGSALPVSQHSGLLGAGVLLDAVLGNAVHSSFSEGLLGAFSTVAL